LSHRKFSSLEKFPHFFLPFLFFPFLLSSFFLFLVCFFLSDTTRYSSSQEQQYRTKSLLMRLPPWRPLVPSLQDSSRPSPSLLLLPLHSLSGELPMAGNQVLKSGNGHPLCKVSTKLGFSSREDQNGCARPSSCYFWTQFYPK
jgi:hypothetical protein